jgi:hypothetical protein
VMPLSQVNLSPQKISSLPTNTGETKERLQSLVEEYETALEELKSSNEELVSVNENCNPDGRRPPVPLISYSVWRSIKCGGAPTR